MSDFITDVERQYEVYCEIAEEHGFIDLNAKKNGFRCTTKSNEFNAGWIAFVGAVAAVRDDQQAKIERLEKQVEAALACIDQAKDGYYGFSSEGGDTDNLAKDLEKALRGES